ncbi:MAG: D-2-hydroxyacid dehydrogenase [Halobacteriota archaeon]
MTVSTILVRNESPRGMPASDYAAALRERLPDATVVLPETEREELDAFADAQVITGRGFDADLLERAESLRLFACLAAGVNHLPLDAFRERDVAVTNSAGVHSPNIAEHVVGSMLMITRRLDEGIRRQERREWRSYWAYGDLRGSTVTIVGMGAIGHDVVERLSGFEVETIGVRYSPEKGGPTDEVYGLDELQTVLSRTDYLVLASPLTEETRGLVGAAELRALPPSAVVVNVGRGPLVDTDALVTALRGNKIRAAALDVTDPEPLPADHPLWSLGNAYVTPHVAGYTPHFWTRRADLLARNVARVEESGEWEGLKNQVAP